ncbi:hypothetical protein WJX72_003019 [[Myrmecia] bisecta]|uniref:UDP-N-acetylglucosamine pyrophosphorylase n=1 Tax=[Myrmecia] bisecta TaxID=41462 RepID=A0AAW1QPZ1_9CHLO
MASHSLKIRLVLAACSLTIARSLYAGVCKRIGEFKQKRSAKHSGEDEHQAASSAGPPAELQTALAQAGQEHLLAEWDRLIADQRRQLVEDIQVFDLPTINRIFASSQHTASTSQAEAEPVASVTTLEETLPQQRAEWCKIGYKLVAEGKLALLLLAGGQGTRLGTSKPKGCYDIGLPSHKSLFQLQAERLIKLQRLAAEAAYASAAAVRTPVRWYIMTSGATDADTKAFFRDHDHFGLDPAQIVFFQQGLLPCLTEEGKIIMDSPCSLAKAPDGNGGVYTALQRCGVLDDMERHGVECVDCYSVDNALVRLGDPYFMGHCWQIGADCGARVMAKAFPEERVGVFARRGDEVHVVEYSELSPAQATSIDPVSGKLRFNWSNVCMHFFRTAFLRSVTGELHAAGRYHVAKKAIQSKDGPVKGIKLELFIFDTFPLAPKTALLEVRRDEEFAPVKNAPGSETDAPETARKAILDLHTRWVKAAGGGIRIDRGAAQGVEVCPLVSYQGEGLEAICKGRTFRGGYDKLLQAGGWP